VIILDLLYGINSIWWRATAETPASVVVDGSGDASDLETDGEVVYKMVFWEAKLGYGIDANRDMSRVER
jgi:hypothetical protein